MPENGPPRPNRWEGTHTYKKPEAEKKRARTVAQLREEASARTKANREQAIKNRRGSIGEASLSTPVREATAESRRGSVDGGNARRNSIARLPGTASATTLSDPEEEEFFDADEMTGSNKKKRQSPGREQAQPESMETDKPSGGVDPEMRALLMSIKTDINESTNAAIRKIDKRISENELAIRKVGEDTREEMKNLKLHVDKAQVSLERRLERKTEERHAKIEERIDALEASKKTAANTVGKLPTDKRREDSYWKCRRTLKAWPVTGGDLVDSLKVFMSRKLGIDDQRIDSFGPFTVVKAHGKAARDRDEVLVTFEDVETRDFVKSTGPSLAGDRSAGMAIHVPGHLLDNFYALNSIGYNIKVNHSGVKRSVKFDDANMNLALDICISGQWKRILPHEAKEALKAAPAQALDSSRSLTVNDLASLIQGEPVAGLTAVVVPPDEQQSQ